MRTTRTTTLAMTLALGLMLAACGGNDPADAPTAEPSPATVPAPAPDDDGTSEDETEDATTDEGSTESATTDDESTPSATGDTGSFDPTASGLAAIETAETETGGTAYELDDEDGDGSWEVDAALDGRSVEVTVGADGSIVGTEDDDLDDEDRAGLEVATVTMTRAVEIAVAEVGGQLDDVELDDEDGTWAWEVSLDDTATGGEVDVRISATTGEIVSSGG